MARRQIIAAIAACLLLAGGTALAGGLIQPPELIDKIKIGTTTAQEVEQILGPPANRSSFPRLGLVSMDYVTIVWGETFDVGVMIDKDGIVRDVQRIRRSRGGG